MLVDHTLAELLCVSGILGNDKLASTDLLVRAIRYDSRAVGPGDLFVAVPGTVTDGHAHVRAAAEAGAVAVVLERAEACLDSLPCLVVPSSRAALADLAAAYYGFPARALHVTGITGTDGKTTSSFLLSHVLETLGHSTGLIGTVSIKVGDSWQDNLARQSTPESPEVQAALAEMVAARVDDAIIEATSHGLVLDRVRGCGFDAALITNVTSEHLDFHGSREHYLDAKALLLAALAESSAKNARRFAAINTDDPGSASLAPRSLVEVLSFGLQQGAALRGVELDAGASGTRFVLELEGRRFAAFTPLPGLFNVYNCLGVLAVVHGRGLEMESAVQALASFAGVPGRMRRIEQGQPFTLVVDYAHTADSLEKVLRTLRPLTQGRLIVVFGSAGDRDRAKRPVMGAVAAHYADLSILTDEDPRMEDPVTILEEIAEGARSAGARDGVDLLLLPGRETAIRRAMSIAKSGDVVLLAGKGHERSILQGGAKLPWDEESVARQALLDLGFAVANSGSA